MIGLLINIIDNTGQSNTGLGNFRHWITHHHYRVAPTELDAVINSLLPTGHPYGIIGFGKGDQYQLLWGAD
ncbi:hypothetical protein OB69_05120 [Roseivirga seohaensis subsp. aquiponti]|uniref:Uncharacterized protein n=1 Tax=Roseivirga seohaensis subsp. aquiponti TaxID=1566026 RepID=A0A0L8AN77_9BACT|nr:hypothetical protein OB69_05120 [Roseivirga seohaensis subsp. aquiponti]